MIATRDHGSLGNNLKVHFAGAEGASRLYFLHDVGVHYYLFTVLPFIKDKFGIKWGGYDVAKQINAYEKLPEFGKHTIMDSGLFSLMFGACKGIHLDEKFIRGYKDAICEFVIENGLYDFTCVECDCQKLLGTELAWKMRKEMREQLPHNRIINVFHFEDGKYGLDRMIEFAEYIAISVPELRIVKPATYKEDTYRLASYIKEKKPEIDIHLLGGTEYEMIRRCKFCTSADSTSYASSTRFGTIMGNHVDNIKPEKRKELYENSKRILESMDVKTTDNYVWYFTNIWISAFLHLKKYEQYAGNQD